MLVSTEAMWLLILLLAFAATISACEGPCDCLSNNNNNIINNKNSSSSSDNNGNNIKNSNNNNNNVTQLQSDLGFLHQIRCLDPLISLIDDQPTCECQSDIRNPTSESLEIKCFHSVPLIETLPHEVTSLVIDNADEYQITNLMMSMENLSIPCLMELTISNSTLAGLNNTLLNISKLVKLNISMNDIVNLSDVKINNESGLRVLDLSNNRLCELPAEAFRTLANLVRLSLRNNQIGRVDENAFVGLILLEDLDMSDNKLIFLPDDTLMHLESLETLNLSGNQLKILGARWFEALGRLRELDVSRNGLTKAASGVLQPLPGLSILRLAENPLMERDVSLLLGTGRRLETVDASHTGLVRIPAALTRSVRALRLAGNKLTCIRDGDFDGYPLLKILDLSDNLLNDVEEDSLGRLETLEKLNLSRNKLKIIPRSLPSSLLFLDLHGNNIKSLTSNDFRGIDNLRCLLLNDNAIEKIDEGAFSQLPFLMELDISNNPIRQLPANTLAGPTRLTELRMSGITSLEWEHEERGDMTFPIPSPEMLVSLDVSHSPTLAAQLLADNAALSACKSLVYLNLINTNITILRSDLVYILPQLSTMGLSGNDWNCTMDLLWLGEWIRQHEEIEPPAKCNSNSDFTDIPLVKLLPLPTTTTVATTMTPIASSTTINPERMATATIVYVNASQTISNTSSYQANIMGTFSKLIVPTVSSNDSNINTVEVALMNIKTTNILDEILTTKINGEDNLSTVKLNHNQLIGISTTLPTTNITLITHELPPSSPSQSQFTDSNTRQIFKLKKKIQTIVDNEKPRIENKAAKIKRPESRKTNEHSELVRDNEGRQRLREILDNRVDSVEREDKSFSKKNAITKSDDGIQLMEPTNNKIASLIEYNLDNTKLHENQLLMINKMKKATNFALANDIANTIAEELNGRATDVSQHSATGIGTHPGMMVLIGAIIGATAALTVVLSRRATTRRRDRYHRHENIEVHTLTPTTELW